jgi:hypothetical protein
MIDTLTMLKGKLYKITRFCDKLQGKLKTKDKEILQLKEDLEWEVQKNINLSQDSYKGVK